MARAKKTPEADTELAVERFDYTEANSRAIKLGELVVNVRNRFSVGDVLSEDDVTFCNAMHADTVRSSFYTKYKAMTEEGASAEDILNAWLVHEGTYVWSPRSSAPVLSARDKMIHKIAKDILAAQARSKGKSIKGANPDVIAAAVARIIEARRAEIEKEADRQLSLQTAEVDVDFDAFADTKAAA